MTFARLVPIVLGVLIGGSLAVPPAGPAPVARAQEAAQENDTCLACHTAPGMVLRLPSTELISVTIDPVRFKDSAHGRAVTCTTCHPDNAAVPHPAVKVRTMREYRDLRSEVCATCHTDAVEKFGASVHGRARQMGFGDAPNCTTCHNPHDAARVKTPAFRNNTPQLCGTCHADPAVMRKYGLRAVYTAYVSEFHGVTTALYRLTEPQSPTPAAICTDCHGGHAIRAASDPASTVHPANVLATCRSCHPTAGRFFATAWTEHRTPAPDASPLVFYVQLFYRILIPATVGFLGLLTVLDLGRWATDQLRRGRGQ